jgi:hypothetical protein
MIKMQRIHICLEENIKMYLNGATGGSDGRVPDARYASFDYCFNYFQSFREAGNVPAIAEPANIQLSCLHLGFYLASWGMLRGSADLLQRSARHLIPVIESIARADSALWEIDAHCYTEPNIRQLLDAGRVFREARPGMSDILVTKIMLGVFGNVPAFDTNFKKGFRVATFGPKALREIGAFYDEHRKVIDEYRTQTIDFVSGQLTSRKYTRAKVIDMIFFIEGMV